MAASSESPASFLTKNPLFAGLSDVYTSFQERREKLGLSNPGTVETISKGESALGAHSVKCFGIAHGKSNRCLVIADGSKVALVHEHC